MPQRATRVLVARVAELNPRRRSLTGRRRTGSSEHQQWYFTRCSFAERSLGRAAIGWPRDWCRYRPISKNRRGVSVFDRPGGLLAELSLAERERSVDTS